MTIFTVVDINRVKGDDHALAMKGGNNTRVAENVCCIPIPPVLDAVVVP